VVVQAPTGSGKTYIFELFYPNLKTQAVFTVPTRVVTTGSRTEPSSSTALRNAPSRAAPGPVPAVHPKLPLSPMIHHKPLMIDERISRIDEVKLSLSIEHLGAGVQSHSCSFMHRKPLMID